MRDVARVLVVEDDEMTRTYLVRVLRIEGHDVSSAVDGADALEQIAAGAPDLVLLDVAMPGVNGIEVCRRLKADPSTEPIPILILSGLTDRDSRIRGVAVGANDYLTKPIDREDLVLRVRNALRMKSLHDQLLARNRELLAMQELREDLTQMLIADNRRIAELAAARDRLRAAIETPAPGPAREPPHA